MNIPATAFSEENSFYYINEEPVSEKEYRDRLAKLIGDESEWIIIKDYESYSESDLEYLSWEDMFG